MINETKHILEAVRNGDLSVDEALLKLKNEPYEDIGFAKVDLHRRVLQVVVDGELLEFQIVGGQRAGFICQLVEAIL